MKYILKKDLPFAKAGTAVGVSKNAGGVPMCLWEHTTPDISKDFIEQLITDGWIEEVKPREFWVLKSSKSGLAVCSTEERADDLADEFVEENQNVEIIKVTENL